MSSLNGPNRGVRCAPKRSGRWLGSSDCSRVPGFEKVLARYGRVVGAFRELFRRQWLTLLFRHELPSCCSPLPRLSPGHFELIVESFLHVVEHLAQIGFSLDVFAVCPKTGQKDVTGGAALNDVGVIVHFQMFRTHGGPYLKSLWTVASFQPTARAEIQAVRDLGQDAGPASRPRRVRLLSNSACTRLHAFRSRTNGGRPLPWTAWCRHDHVYGIDMGSPVVMVQGHSVHCRTD